MSAAPKGRVLAFDTTGALGGVALFDPRHPEADLVETFGPSRMHSARLLPSVRSVLERSATGAEGDSPRAAGARLSLIAATRGPGSFTGLRVGLATLHGLGLALEVPLAGVSSLEAAALADFLSDQALMRRLALVDALRGEVFAAVFGDRPGGPLHPAGAPAGGPWVIRPEDVGPLARREGVTRVCGPGAARYADRIRSSLDRAGARSAALAREPVPLASAAARLGAAMRDHDPKALPASVAPEYLRDPDIHGDPPAAASPPGR